MAYGVNAPFGLRAYGHLLGGADDIKTNSNYIISANSGTLNKGDPVMYVPQNGQYAVTAYNKLGMAEIMLYNPVVTLAAGNNPTTIVPTNGIAAQPIVGVFQGCEYWVNGTYYNQEYWVAGTVATSVVKAFIVDDPHVIWDIQLGTYMGANQAANTQFLLLPCLQIQDASWPDTGGGNNNPTIGNSCVIGSNVALMTGSGPLGGVVGGSASLTTITLNGQVAGYKDNPLIANYGNNAAPSNPLGISTFYACPSIAATTANPSVTDGRNEYARGVTTALKVIGFTPDPRNVPGVFGQPGNNMAGNYFNTPFLNVLVTINNHANKPGTTSVTVA